MMAMTQQSTSGNRYSNDEIVDNSKRPIKTPVPKGCKEYFFLQSGRFFNDRPRKDGGYEVVFECIAANDKSAQRKFDKFKTLNQ